MSCGSYIISNNIHNCKTHTHLWWDDAACALNHCLWIFSRWWTYDAISKRICEIWLLFIFTSRNPKLRSLDFPTWDGFLPPPSKQQNVKKVHKQTPADGENDPIHPITAGTQRNALIPNAPTPADQHQPETDNRHHKKTKTNLLRSRLNFVSDVSPIISHEK